tara:strand:+ start:563 stop:1081 length:519 start_codon:yes stop_codon:yes gene_type:complete
MEQEKQEIEERMKRTKQRIDGLTEEIIEDNKRLGSPLPFSWDVVCNECEKRSRPGKIQELKQKKQMILERVKETGKKADYLDLNECKNMASGSCRSNPNCSYVKRKSDPYCRKARGRKQGKTREGPSTPVARKPTVNPNTLLVGETMEANGITWMVKKWGGKRPHNRWYEQS